MFQRNYYYIFQRNLKSERIKAKISSRMQQYLLFFLFPVKGMGILCASGNNFLSVPVHMSFLLLLWCHDQQFQLSLVLIKLSDGFWITLIPREVLSVLEWPLLYTAACNEFGGKGLWLHPPPNQTQIQDTRNVLQGGIQHPSPQDESNSFAVIPSLYDW